MVIQNSGASSGGQPL